MNHRKQNFFKAVINAFDGLCAFVKNERNGQIQVGIAITIAIAGFYFSISANEWLIVLLCTSIVISLEIINSALEKLSDMVEPNFNLSIKTIKNMAAAAVLWSALISIIIGAIIFIPRIKELLSHFFH